MMEILAPGPMGYVDAGSASFVFQAAIAGAVTASFFVKSWWRKLRGRGDDDGC